MHPQPHEEVIAIYPDGSERKILFRHLSPFYEWYNVTEFGDEIPRHLQGREVRLNEGYDR